MFVRRSAQVKRFLNLSFNYTFKRYSHNLNAEFENLFNQETYLSHHREKKPQKEPLLKNVLIGKIDGAILEFPEIHTSDRFSDFFKWLKPIENYISSCAEPNKKLNKHEILTNLKELEVFRANVDEENNGLNLAETELLMLIETVSTLPWLGTYLTKNHITPIQLISKYGSDKQKREYFPKIMNGELIPTICIKEHNNDTNINNIKSQCIPNEGNTWLLNGEKSFVVNGTNANLFLVFARNSVGETFDPNSVSLFLVERDYGGMTCSNIHETIGRHEIPMCTINFQNTCIPSKNIIGQPGDAFKIMMELLLPGKQNISAQAISILRNFLNQLTVDVIERKFYDREYYKFEFVQKVMGEALYSLYIMESMVYFTSGLMDQYENQDIEIERIITETYCANKCLQCIQLGLQLIGAQGYLNNNSYIQAFHDALALTTIDTNNIDANLYIASAAFKYVGSIIHDRVYKRRNAPFFPVFSLMRRYKAKYKLNTHIRDHFHPSVMIGCDYLKESIITMRKKLYFLLEEHGQNIMYKQIELCRITEMLTEIYATIVTLSRSSRAYSIGLRNASTEKDMAVSIAFLASTRVCAIAQEIDNGSIVNGDDYQLNVTNLAYDQHKYPLEHPLNRTF